MFLAAALLLSGSPLCDVPFRLLNEHVYVPLEIHGRRLYFLFDSGAATPLNLIDARAASDLGLFFQGSRQAGAIGGRVTLHISEPVSISIGSYALPTASLAALDLKGSAASEGTAVDGLLGYPLLQQHIVQVDYPARRFRIFATGTTVQHGRAEKLPIQLFGKVAVIEGSLKLRPKAKPLSIRLAIDTGYDGSLILNRPFATKHKLVKGVAKGSNALGGETSQQTVEIPSLFVGKQKMTHLSAQASMDTRGAFATSDVDGYIGGALLKRFRVTFEYGRQQLILERA